MNHYQQSLAYTYQQINQESAQLSELWFSQLQDDTLQEKQLSVVDIRAQFTNAQRRCLVTLCKSMLREGIFNAPENLQFSDNNAYLRINNTPLTLKIENIEQVRYGFLEGFTGLTLHEDDQLIYVLDEPTKLLALLQVCTNYSLIEVQRFAHELLNSMLNDALFLSYRLVWGQKIEQQRIQTGYASFWSWVKNLNGQNNNCLLLEQWGTVGHPIHPGVKCKQDLTAQQVLTMSPEFQANVAVRLAAVKIGLFSIEGYQQSQYQEWFAEQYPEWQQRWKIALTTQGFDANDYIPVPVHPFQADSFLPEVFADLIVKQDLLLLDSGPQINCGPTMSFRTLVPENSESYPHIKLPIAMRLTSAERVLSNRSCHMGPRVSQFLETIAEKYPEIGCKLRVMRETPGLHYAGDKYREEKYGKYFSVLFRQNPREKLIDNEVAVPVATLMADTPSSDSLFAEIAQSNQLSIASVLETYLDVLLTPVLQVYLRFGISLEAHQQNSMMIFNDNGLPQSLLLRDFGAFRAHQNTFISSGEKLEFHQDKSVLSNDKQDVRNKLLHAVFICHLSELINHLVVRGYIDEAQAWKMAYQRIATIFEHTKHNAPAQWWAQEYQALLNEPWQMKRFTLMRLANNNEYNYQALLNPLSQEAVLDANQCDSFTVV
ncbi:hypothetical protein HWV03_16615 [Moritella sp. 36]|uniref:IucA/IucC family protein n=1 Tax=unclassified Moritella TaxID=2637987 RepID=UPI001BA971B4|nr:MULTISPECIES: IucA/IucC family protein [unclassified Moritella]QUM81790.1 hypothetical protein HWV01_16600 [Moritella sp. 5]QUM90304.1 hypothetical protein HWV03_16615 [Moritella sp. 36]